jgi:hypothetical protein
MSEIGKFCLYDLSKPWDLGTAGIQKEHMVLTPNSPMIYQSDDRESSNKWQQLTDQPLKVRNNLVL